MAVDPNNVNPENDTEPNDKSLEEKVKFFLDQQIFDPENPSNENNWFANLIKNDYDSAEALYVGSFLIIMVILSQELLRMVKYGGGYIPFVGGSGGGGKLF